MAKQSRWYRSETLRQLVDITRSLARTTRTQVNSTSCERTNKTEAANYFLPPSAFKLEDTEKDKRRPQHADFRHFPSTLLICYLSTSFLGIIIIKRLITSATTALMNNWWIISSTININRTLSVVLLYNKNHHLSRLIVVNTQPKW